MTERRGDNGSIAGVPWASVFDPALNIRALGEIQARGFRAATEVVNRFVRMADTKSVAGEADNKPDSAPPPDVDKLLQLWQRMVAQAVESLRGATRPPGEVATFDVQHGTSNGAVCLVAAEPGAVSTEVWLHNAGPEDLGKVRLRCSDLLAHDGAMIGSDMVRFEPDTVPMVARCSRGVTVQVDVPDGIAAAHYRGTLLADGYPDIWLPVVVSVLPRDS
ncbi:hypothetical protein [Mycobacterium shimoidei]|uniref:hypothetical protein n=1 Tax=Mycobacterium shimoidei TaxID=29313 RepID=UPI0008488496|nr:hypothetical protein [Mycobacterium shimoidei]ODR08110.1 hypothetical protein BHQ16_20775 [Mycobacterium shimoidei]ORW76037.1 hypothetical protein AWC26_22195 [Mycobacterium shimoidei]